jgi:prepilin-type N-terminal cleavage/methylation domain-containing protein/prepilin-type processing-associated H-X9-DG protein
VYIPSDQLEVLFGSSAEGVLMPREKILALWEEGHRRPPSQTAPPDDAVLTQATYEAHLEEHALRVTGRIAIAKLRGDWQAVDLPFGGLAIESAQLGGQPARFGRKEDGTLFLLLKEEGRVELQLEMSAPLASRGGDLATTLKLPPVPASELSIRLNEGKQLQVGEMTLQADRSENGQQVFGVAVDRTGLVPLVVSDRLAGGNRTPLIFVHSRSVGHVEPAGLRWEALLDLDVYARAADTFALQLPDSVDVAEIEAPQLGGWAIREQADGTATVTLTFRKPLLGRRTVRLLGLAPVPLDTAWSFPTLKVREAASHVGQVWVDASPSLRIEVGTLVGVRPERLAVTSAHAAPATGGTPLAFAFWDERFQLPIRAIPQRRIVQASVATVVDVSRAGLALRSSVIVEPRHAPLFGVQMQLPHDWEVTSVRCLNTPVEWEAVQTGDAGQPADASRQTVRIDLAKPLNPGQSLEFTLAAQRLPEGWLEQDEGFSELPLPELRLAGADEVEGTLLVQAPADLELLVADLSDDLEPVAADRSSNPSASASGTALQYHYQDDARTNGRLRIRTKPAKVSAETLAFVRLDRGKLDVHYQLDLYVRQGKIRQIRFTLPVAVGEKIQIVPVGSATRVIEQQHSRLPKGAGAEAELYVWQVVLDRPVTGELTLAVDFAQSFSTQAHRNGAAESEVGDADLAGPRVAVPVLALENVSRQSGTVALEAAGDQQIDYKPENLRDLDPADVATPKGYAPGERIVAAYQYQRLPYRLTVSATRHTPESVLTAICESAEITSVAGRQGRMRHQARFWLRSVNLQHLSVTLPKNADLWSVMLDSEPVEVRQKQGTYIVPLPAGKTGSANDARDLTLLYETDSTRLATDGFWGRLWPRTVRQFAPDIAMATLGTNWCVHLPDGTDLVSAAGQFAPVAPLTRATLVSRLADSIAYQSTSSLPLKIAGLVVAVFIAGFFALIKTSNKGGFSLVELLVVIMVIGILIALLLPATQSAREAARRSQCSNNLKQIGLALHSYHDRYGQFPPATIGPHNVPRERQFSWLVAILPFLEQQDLYGKLRLDLPWDHPHNAALLQTPLQVLLCPSDPSPQMTQQGYPKTSYVAITGADSTQGSGSTRGVMGFDKGLRMAEIVDGTSNTIMVAEVTDGGPWFAGGAGTARRIDELRGKETWSQHPGGGNFLFTDGSIRFVGADTEAQILRHLATAQGMEPLPVADSAPSAEEKAAAPQVATPMAVPGAAAPADAPEAAPAAIDVDKAAMLPQKNEDPKLPTLPPNASVNAPPIQIRQQVRVSGKERASLSLRVALETHGGQVIRFRREGGPGELVLGLQDRTLAQTLQWLIVAAALLAAWIGRHTPGPRRAIAVVVGLALPVGLSGLIPLAWTPLLDGLLLGALAAGCLWGLLRILAATKRSLLGPTAGAMALGLGVLFAADASLAGEPRVGAKPQATAGEVHRSNLTLFVPYDPGRDNPLENTQVYLPHDEYLRLWRLAHPEKPIDRPSGVGTIVSHAEYSGQIQNDVARFDGRLLIHHLGEGWMRVSLPLGDVALEKIEINGQPATLAGEDLPDSRQRSSSAPGKPAPAAVENARPASGQPAIYLEKPGLHVVDVRFSVPVSRLGATGQMTVPLRPVSSGRLLFQLPAKDLDVQVSGSPGGWRRHSRGSDAIGAAAQPIGDAVSIPLGATDGLSIRWQPRRVEAREGQLVNADQTLLVEVLDSGVHFHSKFQYRIQQGTLAQLQLRIPSEMVVQHVQGAEVADWSIETGPNPGAQRLVVSLKTERTTGTEVDIHCFRRDRQATGAIDVQSLEPLGVVRETGRIAIGCSSPFRVRVEKTDSVDQINRVGLDLPQKPVSALLSAYRYTSRPWHVGLQVERQRPRVEVSDRTTVAIMARQVSFRSLLTARVTDAPIPSIGLRLPASLRVSQVRVPTGAEWFVGRDDKGQWLKVELAEPALGNLDVAVSGTLVRDSKQAEFVVPGITMDAIQAHRGQLAIYLDDDLEAVLTRDSGARPIDPAALDGALRPDGKRPVHYAFQYESPPKDLRLGLSPAPSRLNADVTTVVSVRDGAVAYLSKVDFEVRQAGRSRFQVVTPQWLGDDVELQGEHIRQIRSQVAGDRRTWDIELQQPVRGAYPLQLIQTIPLPDDGTVPAAIIRPLDVERSRSHVVLENLTSDEIVATKTSGVATIAIAAVPNGLTDSIRRQAVAAYRVSGDPAELAWQRRVREQETGLAASINLADLTMVIHADGHYRARAAYNIRSFTLQFLELQLPPDSQLWSAHVSGQPVRPAKIERQGKMITLLPLQKISAGDFSSKVVVIYSGDLGEPLRRWTQVRPLAPQVLSDVPISRTLWTLLLPCEYSVSLVKGESNLEEVAAAYQQEERKLSFLDELRDIVQVASTKGKSAVQIKARDNLKQVGQAVQSYARQSVQADARNAAEVQEQAQQIETEIKRLEEQRTDTKRADRDTTFYFVTPQRGPMGGRGGDKLDQSLERLPEWALPDDDKAELNDRQKSPQSQLGERSTQRRGDLRKQASEQLTKLQTMEQGIPAEQSKTLPQRPPVLSEQDSVMGMPGMSFSDRRTKDGIPLDGQTASSTGPGTAPVASGTGQLSLELDLALVGTAYHFRKLHGDPRLVLHVRHEDLSRRLLAIVWAGLCLALTIVVIQGLRRPNAAALANRRWPWLAMVAGTVWLFLLPAGVFGLALLVVAMCVLIARLRKQPTTGPGGPDFPHGKS